MRKIEYKVILFNDDYVEWVNNYAPLLSKLGEQGFELKGSFPTRNQNECRIIFTRLLDEEVRPEDQERKLEPSL